MRAGQQDDHRVRPPYRRLAVAVCGATIAVALLWLVASSRQPAGTAQGEKRSAEPAQEIDSSRYLAPLETRASGPGEQTAPFTGFAVSVETEPPGGLVSIRGVPRGEAPVLANIDCRGGERLEILAEKAGFRVARREIACRSDTLVKLVLRLHE